MLYAGTQFSLPRFSFDIFNFFFYQILMSAVPSLVKCADMDGVSMKLVLSNVCVMKDMSLLWMARIVWVCMMFKY